MQIQTQFPLLNGRLMKPAVFATYLLLVSVFFLQMANPYHFLRYSRTPEVGIINNIALAIFAVFIVCVIPQVLSTWFARRDGTKKRLSLRQEQMIAYGFAPFTSIAMLFAMAHGVIEEIFFRSVIFQKEMDRLADYEKYKAMLQGRVADLDPSHLMSASEMAIASRTDVVQNTLEFIQAQPVHFCVWLVAAALLTTEAVRNVVRLRQRRAAAAMENRQA